MNVMLDKLETVLQPLFPDMTIIKREGYNVDDVFGENCKMKTTSDYLTVLSYNDLTADIVFADSSIASGLIDFRIMFIGTEAQLNSLMQAMSGLRFDIDEPLIAGTLNYKYLFQMVDLNIVETNKTLLRRELVYKVTKTR
jgi:hypothetical protein